MNKKDNKIAIVGMACRLPGKIKSTDDYWQVLSQGKDVVTEVSSDRWGTELYHHTDKKEPGKSYTFAAGVLDDIDLFEPAFFGISPREADQMDPQQRLLLELAWETIEDAGLAISKLKGSDCAVYMGIASNDYAHRRTDDLASLDAYTMTGNTASVASNRISYTFDLRGPSVSVDTACSSSLVAIHQACKTLWTSESSMALCGGINMLVHPFPFVGFSKASMLSPNGRCKAFDNSGNGYVRSEGAGMLLLKPLKDAERDGDNIHAVIVNSGVNCDGHTSSITVPGMETQSALLQRLYEETDVTPSDLSYLEAHGTGTAVGDPLEAMALGNTLGKKRATGTPLKIGSAKTNLGHLETASGMAGLLKATLALKHRQIPASLHFKEPNQNIDFDTLNLEVVTELTPLEIREKPHYIGINSFGFGGANAHVLLEEYKPQPSILPPPTPSTESNTAYPPLILSAKTDKALRQLAGSYAQLISESSRDDYIDIAHSARFNRSRLPEAMALTAKSPIEAIESLQSFAGNKSVNTIVTGQQIPKAKLAFVFSGNGSQSQGMGQELYEDNETFKAAFDNVAAHIATLTNDYVLKDELFKTKETSSMAHTEIAQPLLFAIQVGIVDVLKTHGIQPKAVFGHSVGEVAAAWLSGALTLSQACYVIYHRSQAQGTTAGRGRMAAVGISKDALLTRIEHWADSHTLEIAGINGSNAITVAGVLSDLNKLEAELDKTGEFYRLLDLNYAFHSQQMDAIETPIKQSLQDIKPTVNGITYVSTVTGAELSGEHLNAEYWWKNIREPVLFASAVSALVEDDFNVFVEIGPHPILRSYVSDGLKQAGKTGLVYETLKRKQDSDAKLHNNAIKIVLSGCEIEESSLFPTQGKYIKLPTYPWQRERYWYPLTSEGYDLVNRRREHPLLGYRLKDSDVIWENSLDTTELPYLADHVVDDAIVLPAAAYIEMALAASSSWFGEATKLLEMVEIPAPIILEAGKSKTVRFHLDTQDGSFKICSRDRLSYDEWTQNATGRLLGQTYKQTGQSTYPLHEENTTFISSEEHYQLASTVGLDYGPEFRAVKNVQASETRAIAELRLPESLEAGIEHYLLHPSILDSGFQVLVAVCRDAILAGERKALIPVQVGRLHLYSNQASHARSIQLEIIRRSPRSVVANFVLKDSAGEVLAELQNCRFRQLQLKSAVDNRISQYQYLAKLQSHPQQVLESQWNDATSFEQRIQRALNDATDSTKRIKHFEEYTLFADLIAAGYAYQAIKTLAKGENHFHKDELLHQIDSEQASLLQYLLGLLENNNFITVKNGLIKFTDEGPEVINDIWLAIVQESPEYLPELLLLSQCGENLDKVLRGELGFQSLIHNEKSSLFEQMIEVGPSYQTFNRALIRLMHDLASQFSERQTFRLLIVSELPELLLSHLLPILSSRSTQLVIASGNEAALASAERLLEDFEWASCVSLENNQISTMIAETPYDAIVVNHVLHQANNILGSLLALRSMLNTRGHLIVLERSPDTQASLTFGCNPSWWHQDHPRMLSPDSWLPAIEKAGFEQCTATNEPNALLDEGVFLMSAVSPLRPTAQVEVTPVTERWLVMGPSVQDNEVLALSEIITHLDIATASHGDQFTALSDQQFIYDALSTDDTLQLLSTGAYDRLIVLHNAASADLLRGTDHFNALLLALEQLKRKPQLSLVTQGAATFAPTEAGAFCPANSPVWGLGRVIMNEYPDLKCRCIDLQGSEGFAVFAKPLILEILHSDGESEVVLSPDTRKVMRLEKLQQSTNIESDQAAALDFKVPGSFKNLYWKALPETDLKPDEIEIQTVAAGLNFRDLMYAMGLLSDEAVENGFAGASLGMEVSGTVTRIGSAVTEYHIGDEVLGFSPACFSNRVITQTTATAHKPEAWSFEEAATVPTAFFTVYYAFVHLAQLQPGEKVLIHGASGGVGLAAIQLAKHLGATIFATAGTDEKRSLVTKMGADHVLDSRSLAFEEDILHLTHGEGIDVVLNSVYGEAVNRNLSILKPFGRFLELGKRDFYENSRIGLRPFRNNITYFGIDADQLLIERIDLAKRLFADLMHLFHAGQLHPLPYRAFDAVRIQDAFRYMQQSRQIGKVVINIPKALPVTLPSNTRTETLSLDPVANYLVTGGMSGFGLQTAKWLATKGAKHLTLLGRKGLVTEEAIQVVDMLRKAGVTVHTPACDISDKKQVEEVFGLLATTAPELKGIIHAATLFDDGLLRSLTPQRMKTVLAPKALGALHIHEVLADHALDFFVMYSSATTLFGNPGQGNYVAANYMLENLTTYRRAHGLTASFAAWGAISDVGVLARNADTKDSLVSRLGGSALTSTQALDELEQLILSQGAGGAFIDFDWKAIKRAIPSAKDAKFTEQNDWLSRHGGDDDAEDFFNKIEGMSDDDVQNLIAGMLSREISHILRLPIEKIDQNRSVYDLGMDSLMGMELLMAIEGKFNTKLPLMTLSEGGSIRKITERIHAKINSQDGDDNLVVEDLALKHGTELSEESLSELKQSSSG